MLLWFRKLFYLATRLRRGNIAIQMNGDRRTVPDPWRTIPLKTTLSISMVWSPTSQAAIVEILKIFKVALTFPKFQWTNWNNNVKRLYENIKPGSAVILIIMTMATIIIIVTFLDFSLRFLIISSLCSTYFPPFFLFVHFLHNHPLYPSSPFLLSVSIV